MLWLVGVVVVLVMGGIALVASGRGAPMAEVQHDRYGAAVPAVPAEGDLDGQDLRRVRFPLALRGYRMAEVDALLSRLAAQLEADRAWQPAVDERQDGPVAGPAVTLEKPADPEPVDADPERHGGVVPPG
jgi:DivIVA domain-containing protein